METNNDNLSDDDLIQLFLSNRLTEEEHTEFSRRVDSDPLFINRLKDIYAIALINHRRQIAEGLFENLEEENPLSSGNLLEENRPVQLDMPINQDDVKNIELKKILERLEKKHRTRKKRKGIISHPRQLLIWIVTFATAALVVLGVFKFFRDKSNANIIESPEVIAQNFIDWKKISFSRSSDGNSLANDFLTTYYRRDTEAGIALFENEEDEILKSKWRLYAGIMYLHENNYDSAINIFQEILNNPDSVITREDIYFAQWYLALSLTLDSTAKNYAANLRQAISLLESLQTSNPEVVKQAEIPELLTLLQNYLMTRPE